MLENTLSDRPEWSILNQLDKRAILPFSAMLLIRNIPVAGRGTSRVLLECIGLYPLDCGERGGEYTIEAYLTEALAA